MNTRRKNPAIPHAALFCAFAILTGLLPAPCLAQQPDSAPPAGQNAPQGEGAQRRTFRGNGIIGRIASIAPGEMKVSTPDGGTVIVHLSAKTAFRLEQQTAKLEDLKTGMMVFVRGTKADDGSWAAEAVSARTGPPGQGGGPEAMRGEFVAGTVKAIDGTKITVLRLDGSTQTIEVDENTSLHKRRESITLADIHPGDAVISRGEMKDGAFVPKTLNVVDPEQLQRMRQFMGGGGPPSGTNPPPGANPPPAPNLQAPPAGGKPPQDPF
jgi:hypothetical protein